MKRLHTHSQHFLRSPAFVKELIGHTSIKRSDVVYDIGAGSGVITSALASRCKEVIAVEVEPGTANILRKNTTALPNVRIVEKDFLNLALPDTPYKVFANIPFHISSEILRKITEASNPPEAAYLIVQKQFANKLLPDNKGFSSQLGMVLGTQFAIRIRKRLKRTDFWPHPNVDTVFLEIKLREEPLVRPNDFAAYERFVRKNFTSPESFKQLPLHTLDTAASSNPSSLQLTDWVLLFQKSK